MFNEFHAMVTAYLPRLRAYAMLLSHDRTASEDLVQETVLRALKSQAQFEIGTNFGAWTCRILRNEYISSCRRSKRNPVSTCQVPDDLLARPGDQDDKILTREVLRAMDKLDSSQREVLILICGAGMAYEEVAQLLRCSIGTVKSRMWRARARMKELLLGDDVERVERLQRSVSVGKFRPAAEVAL
jgi:RNA polymerase sigma-70 factor (ECF subfamily)